MSELNSNITELLEKWDPVINHPDLPAITDPNKRKAVAVLLENQERDSSESKSGGYGLLDEAAITNSTGASIANFDPIMISMLRRSTPNLIAFDIMGVQPMSGPTGLVFAMRSKYTTQAGTEALFNESDTDFSGTGTHAGTDPFDTYTTGGGLTTAVAEKLGRSGETDFAEMAFSIEKISVTAKSRALKAEYTLELAQDLKAIHNLDAESELSTILSTEIMSEINREMIRKINFSAKAGSQTDTATAGTFDLDVDSNGRWAVEKFKGLMFNIERDANAIAKDTRRGRGNIILCSSDTASALAMTGVLDYNPALQQNLTVDDTGSTFAGVLNNKYRLYIDPYVSGVEYYSIGYKGSSQFDAGLFYCPYVPLQMVRAMGENTFQPKIGFKTRYGLVANPFATTDADGVVGNGADQKNKYYRISKVTNLM
jgi:hypothetical protein